MCISANRLSAQTMLGLFSSCGIPIVVGDDLSRMSIDANHTHENQVERIKG